VIDQLVDLLICVQIEGLLDLRQHASAGFWLRPVIGLTRTSDWSCNVHDG